MAEHVKLFPTDSQEGYLQVSNISGYKGSLADQMSSMKTIEDHDAQAVLDDLRKQYETLRGEVASAVSLRAEQASKLAAEGADGLRSQIRSQPVASLAIAAVAGGLIAVLLTQTVREPTWQEKASRYGSSLRDIDLGNIAERLRNSADAAYSSAREQASGIMPSVERLAQSLSAMDTTTFQPAIEKGTSLFKSLWNSVVSVTKS